MNYFSLETSELSFGKRAGFFLKEGFFKGQKRGRADDKCDLPLCVDWTGLVSQSSSSCWVDASISIQNHLLSFQLNENPQWHFRDKMSRCMFIFRRKWITTHPFCKKRSKPCLCILKQWAIPQRQKGQTLQWMSCGTSFFILSRENTAVSVLEVKN